METSELGQQGGEGAKEQRSQGAKDQDHRRSRGDSLPPGPPLIHADPEVSAVIAAAVQLVHRVLEKWITRGRNSTVAPSP